MPSSRVRRRAISNASRSPTRTHRSTVAGSYVPGKKSSPTPSVRYGRAISPDRTLPSGSAPIHLDGRVARLQETGRAGDGATGADARDEVGDPPVGLLPQLRAGRPLVGGRVLRVPVLVGLERARDVTGEPGGDRVVALGRFRRDVGRAQHDLGAVRPQELLLLGRLLVGHDEDAPVTLERRGDRQAVPGVPRGRLDDRAAGLEQARPLGRLDHRQADPVLHRAARVEHLQLRQQERLTVDRGDVADEPADPDERRVADQVEDRLGVLHRG